jgi:hypothetical protein
MPTETSPDQLLQFAAVAIIGIFVLGFVFSPLGAWTGAVLAAWFIGTQKAWRGFLLLAGINFVLSLLSNWRASPLTGIEYAGWTMLAVLIGALPFLLYRLTSQRRPGFLSTLSLPLWGTRATVPASQHVQCPLARSDSVGDFPVAAHRRHPGDRRNFVSHLLVRGGN